MPWAASATAHMVATIVHVMTVIHVVQHWLFTWLCKYTCTNAQMIFMHALSCVHAHVRTTFRVNSNMHIFTLCFKFLNPHGGRTSYNVVCLYIIYYITHLYSNNKLACFGFSLIVLLFGSHFLGSLNYGLAIWLIAWVSFDRMVEWPGCLDG